MAPHAPHLASRIEAVLPLEGNRPFPGTLLMLGFATLVGSLVLAEPPNALAATGIVITTAFGLYAMYRERCARPLSTGADL